ncbi:hypothetical protein [Longimicrobium sp.]|uniref:hypothetical protein n=1 Tax=Longimicrobium sp. TaxID=2029185 RepID=UPI003B3A74E3
MHAGALVESSPAQSGQVTSGIGGSKSPREGSVDGWTENVRHGIYVWRYGPAQRTLPSRAAPRPASAGTRHGDAVTGAGAAWHARSTGTAP